MREAFSVSRSARSSAGAPEGTPSSTEPSRPCLRRRSSAFSRAQLWSTCSAPLTCVSPKTWGWRETILSEMAVATSAQVELAELVGQLGVEDDLEEQIAQLLAERTPGTTLAHPVHLLQDLVRLLDQVGAKGPDVLLAVPGAAALCAQGAHDLLQPLCGLACPSHVLLDPGTVA